MSGNDSSIQKEKIDKEESTQKKDEPNIADIQSPDKKDQSEQFMNYINSNREITNEEVKIAPIVTLTEEEGNIFNGKEVKITASGLIGGRNSKDGVALFGFAQTKKEAFKNDLELNCPSSVVNNSYPFVFVIYYQRETKNYFIRAYSGQGSDNRILFVKLTNSYDLPLKQKEIFYSGNILFQATPSQDGKILEISSVPIENEQICINKKFDSNTTKEVTIGRDSKCTFAFPKDKSFSRTQTTFFYDENNKQWVMMDGSKMKASTNGTWVFGLHSFVLKDQMIIEILRMKIKICLTVNPS